MATSDEGRRTWTARLGCAPFPWARRPEQSTSGLVYPPAAYESDEVLMHLSPAVADGARPRAVVVWLHGQQATLRDRVIGGVGVPGQIDAAGAPLALIAPQLALNARDSCPGKLEEAGGLKRLLDEAATHLARGGDPEPFRRAPLVIAAFSGGYRGAAACLSRGGRRAAAVILMDALYSRLDDFVGWRLREPAGALLALYGASTAENTLALKAALAIEGVPVGDAFTPPPRPGDVRLVRVHTEHLAIPVEGPPAAPVAAALRALLEGEVLGTSSGEHAPGIAAVAGDL